MAKSKKKKKNARAKPPVSGARTGGIRLSQCMIVKDEEKNIERALSWGKDIMYEQIVVDTGSTDRTVEIAERMGATIYHFKWINDFAAAKNYAIEQASGDWIAFLDADEYFPEADVPKLIPLIEVIDIDPNKYNAIACNWIQLDDNLKATSIFEQVRLFKNSPEVRYEGTIHETLKNINRITITDIGIMHTGYAESVRTEKSKAERNLALLRVEHEKDPDNLKTIFYLADSIYGLDNEDTVEEAMELYRKVIDSDKKIEKSFKWHAYRRVIIHMLKKEDNPELLLKYVNKAVEEHPDSFDLQYLKGCYMMHHNRLPEAWEIFVNCEKLLDTPYVKESNIIISNPGLLFGEMAKVAQRMDKHQEVITYATKSLKYEKRQDDILIPYLRILHNNGASAEETLGLLCMIYDFTDISELIYLARMAKEAGVLDVANMIVQKIKESGLLGGEQQ